MFFNKEIWDDFEKEVEKWEKEEEVDNKMNDNELNNKVDEKLNLILESISSLVVNKRERPEELLSTLNEIIVFVREKCY
jgi:hypothetical protein